MFIIIKQLQVQALNTILGLPKLQIQVISVWYIIFTGKKGTLRHIANNNNIIA